MPRVQIHEGTSGIVELKAKGIRETYFPDNDLDRTLELLFRLYELKDAKGKRFLDNYHHQGFNWLSTQVGNLYWRFLFRHVQYAPLLARFKNQGLVPHFTNKVNLARIWEVLNPKPRPRLKDYLSYEQILPRHNRQAVQEKTDGLLFYRYGPNDFRTTDMLRVFENKGLDFHFVYSPSKKLLKKRLDQPHPVYFLYRKIKSRRIFDHDYDFSGLTQSEAELFRAAISRVEENMSFQVWEYQQHVESLKIARPKVFFGLDDHQEVHPILFACKTLGIPSIGYQLGMYSRKQAAYVLERWEPGAYQWYDQVIVWGKYWEDVIRRHSKVYPKDFFLLGANKHDYGYKRLESNKFNPKNILVPYEFWGNTKRIGEYIVKLMDLGFKVYFKFKPDERPERQLACYHLPPEYAQRLILVERITDELMAEINIVAGGMTTLLYDLLPYGKHTWVLDTEFKLLEDMVEDKLAELVRYEDLEKMAEPDRADRDMDYTYIFNQTPLEDVLAEHVLGRL